MAKITSLKFFRIFNNFLVYLHNGCTVFAHDVPNLSKLQVDLVFIRVNF
jgi:hypothetical protein